MDCFKQDALCPFFDAIPRFKEEFERMAKYSPQDILRMVEENQVRFIRLQFTDIFGAMKCVNVTASQLQKVLRNECKFDGSSIEGFTRIEESDMCLYPDTSTYTDEDVIAPFRSIIVGVLCFKSSSTST